MHFSFAVLVVLAASTSAYPSGAPVSRCASMVPVHGVDPQNTTAPYTMTLSQSTYTGGQALTVTIQSTDTNSSLAFFRGLLVEVRRASCLENQDDALGAFTMGNRESELQLLSCSGDTRKSGITHTSKADKTSKTFTWTAPATAQGHVQIRATIVRETKVFWTNVLSNVITDPTAPNLPTPAECNGGVTSQSTAATPRTGETTKVMSTTPESGASRFTLSSLFAFVVVYKIINYLLQ